MSIPVDSAGGRLISAIIAAGSVDAYEALGPCSHLYEHAHAEGELYAWLENYIKQYGKVPDRNVLEKEHGVSLPDTTEPPEYYKDKLFDRHLHNSLVYSGQEASELMLKKQPKEAFEVLRKMVKGIEINKILPQVSDFKDVCESIMKSIAEKLGGSEGVELGWPSLDGQCMGLRGGDLVSFVGRPGQGKTFLMLHSALHIWSQQKLPVLFVSMEMPRIEIMERLAVMQAKMPYEWIKTGGFPTLHKDNLKLFKLELEALKESEASLRIVDMNLTGTVSQVEAMCSSFKPAAVFVDGAYLLKPEAGKFGKYEKIGEVCRELKHMATRCNVPVIASWQLNRESTKAKAVSLEHIAGSDEIGQLSSVVLGILLDDASISTALHRKIDILKGRNGAQGMFYTNWNFQKMNFSEIEPDYSFEVV